MNQVSPDGLKEVYSGDFNPGDKREFGTQCSPSINIKAQFTT